MSEPDGPLGAEALAVCHLSWLLSRRGGGIPPSMMAMAAAQRSAGHRVSVMGVTDPRWPPLDAACGPTPETFSALGPTALGLAPGLARRLRSLEPQIVHLHGLFTWPSQVARRWRATTGGPLVVSAHGMLTKVALRRSAWKKRIFAALIENANLRSASCLHALTEDELAAYRRQGLVNPVAVVPGGIDPAAFATLPEPEIFYRKIGAATGRKLLLFLGRIHPIKGLENLMAAWARVLSRDRRLRTEWLLVLAGPDQRRYRVRLLEQMRRLGIGDAVRWVGPLYGQRKLEALSAASGFVLPSLSEGLPMVVLEALASGLPVLLTSECRIPQVETRGAGWSREPTTDGLAEMLTAYLESSDGEREAMGQRGRALAAAEFDRRIAARRLLAVYCWLLGGAPRPDWVVTD